MTRPIAVIILNWNGENLLKEYLPSVIACSNPELARIIVADNFSTDNSVKVLQEEFPDIEVLLFDQNYGFAGGYNKAIQEIEAEYIVLLNSDVEVTPHWLEPLYSTLKNENSTAAVQPKIKSYKEKDKFEYAGACGGFIDKYGFPFCRGRILNTTERDTGQYDDTREIFWASGAALFIRRQVYLDAGGLDNAFFAHMEEIDLCWRIKNAGHSVKVVPSSTVFHLGGGSLPMNHPKKLFLNYRNNLLMLYKNLTIKERHQVLGVRIFMDAASFCIFLLKGQFRNAGSLWKAYRSYASLKTEYQPASRRHTHTAIYTGSIVIAYFLKKQRIFSRLKW